MLFNDNITVYQYKGSQWIRNVIHGVQWADKTEKADNGGKISVSRYVSITIPAENYNILLSNDENTAIFYGIIYDTIDETQENRLSDLLEKYPKSGRIQTINDNLNRDHLKNIKIIIA